MALFGRKSTGSSSSDNAAAGPNTRSRSMFGRNKGSSVDQGRNVSPTGRTGSGGLFNRNKDNLSVAQAKVKDAEKTEKQTEKMLQQARAQTKEAKKHVSLVEHEADVEARNAARKQKDIKGLRKTTKGLGRV
ncbi:hypothetical protein M407DRAFT_22375 [Tulasnella calospora MUT 4182]|uniref:Uncharacterized protein n=1 Tax=Tulasnella calospora MUT 4182 TaxID=1051891 RepID=A0A0C3QCL1_9AGAM|nr:hypothetical protein M407DRAFT_22375 [Tulasnella calospora MUT 4182]